MVESGRLRRRSFPCESGADVHLADVGTRDLAFGDRVQLTFHLAGSRPEETDYLICSIEFAVTGTS